MVAIPDSKTGKPEYTKPYTSVTHEDEEVFEFKKKEHRAIYNAFLFNFNKEKIQERIDEIWKEVGKKKPSEQQGQELKLLHEKLDRLDKEEIFPSIFDYRKKIFSYIDQGKTKPLSEENFCQFLLSVFKGVREKKLAVEEVVKGCVDDIRGTEAKDSLVKLVGLPFGIKVDPKNISSSFMNGVKEKIPFLGKDKKEEDEPPLSDEEMVTTFLRKIFLPISFSIASILIFGPTTLAIVAAVIGTIFAVKGGVEVLFSNNRPGTLYNPHPLEKERKKWDNEISDGINKVLEIEVKKIPEQISQGNNRENEKSEQSTVLEQVTLDQQKTTMQQPNNT
ncbi:hypothetical protein [Wolbachia endosymbiont (group A) of Agelastica alni]|uniref:hypothetical protein n=1 Tax=Wolbachia endosymbiont (group A) of Agelastica alni TaxID=3066130 RepID=UPI003342BAE6